jgi:hypothetical protein
MFELALGLGLNRLEAAEHLKYLIGWQGFGLLRSLCDWFGGGFCG